METPAALAARSEDGPGATPRAGSGQRQRLRLASGVSPLPAIHQRSPSEGSRNPLIDPALFQEMS